MPTMHHDFQQLEIPLIIKLLELYKRSHLIIRDFPKFERYALGEKIEKTALEAIELVFLANSAPKYEKERWLQRVNSKIELLKLLYRVALDTDMLKQSAYISAQKLLQEIGRMTQGWIKYTRTNY